MKKRPVLPIKSALRVAILCAFAGTASALLVSHTHTISDDPKNTNFTAVSGAYKHEALAPTSGSVNTVIYDADTNTVSLLHPSDGICQAASIMLLSANYRLYSTATISVGIARARVRGNSVAPPLCETGSGN